jgi:hypothetical protein
MYLNICLPHLQHEKGVGSSAGTKRHTFAPKGSSMGTRASLYPYVALTWPHVPRKFTRQSHLAFAIAAKRLFSSPGNARRVGSIPIARSTFRCLACLCVDYRKTSDCCEGANSRDEHREIAGNAVA